MVITACLLTGLAGGRVACRGGPEAEGARTGQQETAVTAQNIEEAQAQLTDSVMSLPGVVGIGIGECQGVPCIKVFVVQKTAELAGQIPQTYAGFAVEVEETGEFRPREDSTP